LYKDNTARADYPGTEPFENATDPTVKKTSSMNPTPIKDSERPTEGPTRTENAMSHSEDFAAVLESFEAEQAAQAEAAPADDHHVIKGTVINITPTHVVVDIGNKSDGMVPIAEATDREGKIKFQPGDAIDVVIDRREHEEGYLLLSHQKAIRNKAWDDIERAYNGKSNIKGFITERVKGGITVEIEGVKAFMPASQLDVKPAHNLDTWLGQAIDVRIIKLNKKRGNIVVSRKAILDEEVAKQREETLKTLEEGAVLTGTVKNLTDYGAFVDLGGIDGLLHITDMSWGRLTHPRDLVHVGDEIHVKVLKFDREKQRVSLGFKQLTPDPWLDAAERYPVGAHVKGRVLSVTDYGAFVELEQGIEGLVHVSEMTWSKRTKHPSKIVQPGQEVECVILNVNPAERRISLGMKQLEPNPWDNLHLKYPVNSTVEGRVRNLTDFGAFVEIEDGIDGLIHVSNMSWTKRIKHPSEVVKKGDKVQAIVLAIEPEHRRLSLGMKQLQPDVWETFFSTHRVGDLVHGKVLRHAQFGYFVELAEGIEGLCHNSEAVDEHGAPAKLEPGTERDFKIVKMNPEEKKIGLSLKAIGEEASRADVEAYKAPPSSSPGSATLGEIINWKKGSS
jgi:small subunit ribosomal protein S1